MVYYASSYMSEIEHDVYASLFRLAVNMHAE